MASGWQASLFGPLPAARSTHAALRANARRPPWCGPRARRDAAGEAEGSGGSSGESEGSGGASDPEGFVFEAPPPAAGGAGRAGGAPGPGARALEAPEEEGPGEEGPGEEDPAEGPGGGRAAEATARQRAALRDRPEWALVAELGWRAMPAALRHRPPTPGRVGALLELYFAAAEVFPFLREVPLEHGLQATALGARQLEKIADLPPQRRAGAAEALHQPAFSLAEFCGL